MLLPQTKEREYRFKLALRMGLPIFALVIALIIHTFISNRATLQTSFYVEAVLLLLFSIYFIFYLIYNGFRVKITDDITKTFTREYLFDYLKKEIQREKNYTLVVVSVDNLDDINSMYGMKNGDRVLEIVSSWVAKYFEKEDILNFPMGHIKSGDFIIGIDGSKEKYNTIVELLCLKASEFKVDDIEVKISGAITDTSYSRDLDFLIENLFELQKKKKNSKRREVEEDINPNDLEIMVAEAIEKKSINIMTQNIFESGDVVSKECFVKLINSQGKLLYPKLYMKVIKKLGLSIEYDLMIIKEIFQKTQESKNMRYAINIAPTSLRNEKFLIHLEEMLKVYSGSKLIFILSEEEYYSYITRYKIILKSLKNKGILIAIDRVGSLHTSFLYLRELEINFIRYDSFYSNENKLEENRSIIEGFNIMAQERGVKTWIKNIENKSTLTLANRLNINYIQGKELSELEDL